MAGVFDWFGGGQTPGDLVPDQTGGLLSGQMPQGSGLFGNPVAMAGLGGLANMLTRPRYSRLPGEQGTPFGNALSGMLSGYDAGLKNQNAGLELAKNKLGVAQAVWRMGAMQDVLNGNPIRPFTSTGAAVPTSGSLLGGPSAAAAPTAAGASDASPAPSVTPAAAVAPQPASPGGASGPVTGAATAGFTPEALRQAFTADLLMPGSGKDILAKSIAGPTDLQRAVQYAQSLPPGPLKTLAATAVYKAAGMDPTVNMRPGGALYGIDPRTGQYGILAQQPQLGQGQVYDPSRNAAVPVTGYLQNLHDIEDTTQRTKANYEPMEVIDPQTGARYVVPRSTLMGGPNGGTAPRPGVTMGPVGPILSDSATRTAPGAATPDAAAPPSRLQTSLSPLQNSSAEARGKKLEEYSAGLDTNATNARNQQFLIDQMRLESGNGAGWAPGHFAEWGGTVRSLLNGAGLSGPETDTALANYQAFQKNAMQLTTAATRAVSPRAAVQEMQMIRDALPGAKTSQGGLAYMLDQFSANNDFQIAKSQAAQAWRTRKGGDGTLNGFESNWNQNISPYAFLVHRMTPEALQTMAANLQKTTQGRALLNKITAELKFAQSNNLFQDGGQ